MCIEKYLLIKPVLQFMQKAKPLLNQPTLPAYQLRLDQAVLEE